MPTCGNCRQEVDFYEHGGLFYCNECDTQSQVMRVIEDDEEFKDTLDFARSYSTTKTRNRKKTEKDNNDSGQERSWWSCELYQAILKAQVKALVGMRFPAKLDEIVMQLWFRYLSKSGVAFCKAGTNAKRQLDDSDDEVDKEEDAKNKQSPSVMLTQTKGCKTYSKDDWLHRTEKGNIAQRFHKSKADRIRLCLWDSVCFMYVGLQLLDEPVLMSDMIRWVRQGHLPLRSTADIIPEHISKNLSAYDIHRFCNPSMSVPDVNFLYDLFHRLSPKLDITPRPISQRVMSFTIASMIHSLNLPAELCHLAHRLYVKVQPSLETSTVNCNPLAPECHALGYIIVSLKLLLSLNDRSEHVFSTQTRLLQSLFPEVRLFNWDVWVEAQKLRVLENLSQAGCVQNLSDLKKVQDMPGFVQNFKNFFQVEQVHKHMHLNTNHNQHGRQEWLKEYQRPFRALNKESTSTQSMGPSSIAMGRMVRQPDCNDCEDRGGPSAENSDDLRRPSTSFEWLPRDYLLNEDFSKHTLKHLTNLQELCEQYIIPPQSVRKILASAEEQGRQAGSNRVDETRSKVNSSVGNKSSDSKEAVTGSTRSSPMTGKRKGNYKEKSSQKKHKGGEKIGLSDEESSEEPTDEDVNKKSNDQLRGIRLDNTNTPYVTYPTISRLETQSNEVSLENQMDCFHTSMAWLLNRCGKMSEMKQNKFISFCVYNVEKVLLKE